MLYLNCKKTGRTQDAGKKPMALKALDTASWERMLEMCADSKAVNKNWVRDYMILFLGCALGMRRGEVAIFERNHFRDMDSLMVIHVPTLKQSERIQYQCPCGKRCRVRAASAGEQHTCAKCGQAGTIPTPKGKLFTGVVERELDIVEEATIGTIQDYLAAMRPDQKWLFEGRKGEHVSTGHVNRIFNTFAHLAGVNPRISFHSMRHNRGVMLWSKFHDLVLVKNSLRHKDIKTSQIYADLDAEQKDEYRKQLNKRAFDPRKKLKEK